MECKVCKAKMNWSIEGRNQVGCCPVCGWELVTTYTAEIDIDITEYSLYVKNVSEINFEKIKTIAKISGVNYITARQMLEKKEVCILKARAPEVKAAIAKLQELGIAYDINPIFKY